LPGRDATESPLCAGAPANAASAGACRPWGDATHCGGAAGSRDACHARCGADAPWGAVPGPWRPRHADQDGSGLHITQFLRGPEGNAFFEAGAANGQLSETGLSYIGGLLAHARGFTLVTNPTVNSYKRLVPGYDAPSYVQWSQRAKRALVRVPAQQSGDVRVELRSPDPSCNPYLALACIIKSGLDGVRRKLVPGDPVEINVALLSDDERTSLGIERLPASLKEAIFALDADPIVRAALGDHSYHRFREAKLAEWEAYRTQVHPWELEAYLSL